MSTEGLHQDAQAQNAADVDAVESPTSIAPPNERRRPRLDTAALGLGGGERKRGKSMFGVLVNTLNKAKAENKERNASEAAKKRQLIDQRLQNKLRKETDIVRQVEDAKKDRTSANRKEEEWQMKDSLQKLRRKRLPLLANFLSTSDNIRSTDEDMDSSGDQEASLSLPPPRSHPAPLFYLPAKLLPEQEAFLKRRQELAKEVADKEWESFKEQRAAAVEEISAIRRKVAEAESAADAHRRENGEHEGAPGSKTNDKTEDTDMDVDDGQREGLPKKIQDSHKPPTSGDEDDAVEY